MTCEYQKASFYSLLSVRNSTLSLGSLKRVLQLLVVNKHYQTFNCVNRLAAHVSDIQESLGDCESTIAFAEMVHCGLYENVGQGDIFN